MNTIKKLVLILGIAFIAVACDKNEQILQRSAEQAAAKCPIPIDFVFTLSGVEYKPGDKYFTYTYLLNENQLSMEWLRNSAEYVDGELFKEDFMSSISDLPKLLRLCAEENVEIKHIYQGTESGEQISLIYNPKTNVVTTED